MRETIGSTIGSRFVEYYNSVRITRDDPYGQELQLAVNIEGEGLFIRGQDGQWQQREGTGQFSAYSAAELVRRYRRDQGDTSIRMVRGSASGWTKATS